MEREFWELFKDTGEPMCWLLHRRAETMARRDGPGADEDRPRTGDKR